MELELHIAGIGIFCLPAAVESVRSSIKLIPGAEIHAASLDGKLVVTLETEGTRRTLDYMDAIRALPGVVNVYLVYQHAEPLSALEEEVGP